MNLEGQLLTVAELTPDDRGKMFALMQRYYANVRRAEFDADLDEKQWVIRVVDPDGGAIRGFSTQRLLDLDVDGRQVLALFSGDTIVHRDHWGSNPLAQVWGHFAVSLIDAHPFAELFWFLISKGYKTYRFLPVFFHEFYPRHDRPTPQWGSAILDAAARQKYAESYDAAAGVIRAGRAGCRLQRGVADLTPGRLSDPHVRFFASRNPGHARGDELCCIAPLSRDNFTKAAHRVMGPQPAAFVVQS